ncbi:hypothetical protein [Oceanobacillus halotolerans]|uniref:hypothetical protein n=1 Tax=Oceanobacillus halotolerans TaxID=2663380 RepID=UPI0013DBA6DB|nr:hypothetical protein [Oceanobacillus halotolerans]
MDVARELTFHSNGVEKETYAKSLQYISDQVRKMEQKLIMKVDDTIEHRFNEQYKEAQQTKRSIVKLYKN